ncbi:DUF58 domain-containing protein [Peribacillus sp. SCS-155]|uniref:DUF58 domain-containing protein n=1 Tax=Peribacillus sedimenti TaxID=3115297 RepID=UPI003905AA15
MKRIAFTSGWKSSVKLAGLCGLIAATFVFAMFQGGFVSWFLFASFLPFAIYSIALSFYSIHDFTVDRIVSKSEFRAGDNLEVELNIQRKIPFPLYYLLIEEQLPEKLEKNTSAKKKILVFPWFKRNVSLLYTISTLPRGEHILKSVRIKTGDFLGLFEKETEFPIYNKLLVFPAYYELPYRQLDNLFDQGQAGKANRLQRENSIVTGVREYQQGDQFSWINWKATAKKNDFMTKEFEERKSHDLFLVLDETASECFEDMISYTASFVHSIIKKGIQTGFFSLGANGGQPLSVKGGEMQKQRIFYSLALAEETAGPPIEKIVETNKHMIPSSAALIIVTSSLSYFTIETLASFKTSQQITVFSIKNKSALTREEIMLREASLARGIGVKYINKGQILSSLSGVIAQ